MRRAADELCQSEEWVRWRKHRLEPVLGKATHMPWDIPYVLRYLTSTLRTTVFLCCSSKKLESFFSCLHQRSEARHA